MDRKTLRHKVELVLATHDKMSHLMGDNKKTITIGEYHRRVAEILKEIYGWINQ